MALVSSISHEIDRITYPTCNSGRPAAVLDVRLCFRADSGEKNTRLRLDEGREVGSDPSPPEAPLLQALIY